MPSPIDDVIAAVRREHGLDDLRAGAVWVWAPFGAEHVATCVATARRARTLAAAVTAGTLEVIAFTSEDADVDAMPAWVRLVRLAPVRGWPSPPAYQNRFVKWALPFLLPGVDVSIYADGDLAIIGGTSWLGDLLDLVRARELVTSRHVRRGWHDEYVAILATPRFVDLARLEAQRRFYDEVGLPAHIPVFQNNAIGRRHGAPGDRVSAVVLEQLRDFSHRDQLALPYAAWRTGFSPFGAPPGGLVMTSFADRLDTARCGLVDPNAWGRYWRLRLTGQLLRGTRLAHPVERLLRLFGRR